MFILLWITIEMEYKIKCLKFILFFTNGRQKLTAKGLKHFVHSLLIDLLTIALTLHLPNMRSAANNWA